MAKTKEKKQKGGFAPPASDSSDRSASRDRDGVVSKGVIPSEAIPAAAVPAPSMPSVEKDGEEDLSGLTTIMKYGILFLICIMAFAIRLIAVVRFESVIHEFDPYFNFRTTKFLAAEGFLDFLNWFDDRGWYPLGRTIGGTIYPGLMLTAACIYWVLRAVHITINIRNVCVFLAPVFAANTAVASYLLTTELTHRSSTGLLAAAFAAIVPSYISRSMGGSYDNEGVAIFALVFTFYLWIKAVNTGRMMWSMATALSYFYMVAAWGGYVFIINIIPIHTLVLIAAGRFSSRLYVAYSIFYVLGSLMAMQVPFVGFNVIMQAECAASHGMFIAVQAYALVRYFLTVVDDRTLQSFRRKLVTAVYTVVGCVAAGLLLLQYFGILQWTGRSLTLLDPTYATKFIPIIASVSEHQPTTWTSFFFDLHVLVPLSPVGLYFLYRKPTDAAIFIIIYGTLSWYFAGVMVRLMLTLAPVACILGAVGLSTVLQRFCSLLVYGDAAMAELEDKPGKKKNKSVDTCSAPLTFGSAVRNAFSMPLGVIVVIGITVLLCMYSFHSSFVSSIAYANPSIVIDFGRLPSGQRILYDDYREAYYWLRHNTAPDAKILSWWDYGYQMSSMSNRTVLVDNNTWNNTHIATVGRALASTEEKAYPILKSLDVDYVLVIFGGLTGYTSDDVNKFLWPVRIGSGVFGSDMHSEADFMSDKGSFEVSATGSKTFQDCLCYKLSYYRFGELRVDTSKPAGYDRVRNVEIGRKDFSLTTMEEAFTSEHWIVRIYRVLPEPVLQPTANAPALERVLAGQKPKAPPAKERSTRYVGCYYSESSFGGKQYVGGTTPANHRLLLEHTASLKKRYFAAARNGVDGHGFAFDAILGPEGGDVKTGGCDRPCEDVPSKNCGCMDAACSGPKPATEEHNRRWAVYEILGKL